MHLCKIQNKLPGTLTSFHSLSGPSIHLIIMLSSSKSIAGSGSGTHVYLRGTTAELPEVATRPDFRFRRGRRRGESAAIFSHNKQNLRENLR